MKSLTTNLVLPADAPIDLQMHTTLSDGEWRPEQLLDYLVNEHFGLAAITDHDRVDITTTLQQLAAARRFPLLVAVEMSTTWRGEPTDVLCFGFDPEQNELQALAQDVLRRQSENTQMVCDYLRSHGINFPREELDALLSARGSQQPPMLFALLEKYAGNAGSKEPSIDTLLTDAGFAWAANDIASVVDAAHRSDAVCLIAHPGRGGPYVNFDVTLLDELRRETPIDGIEVYHPDHSSEQVAMFRQYADTHQLLTSSGSDSHRPTKPPIKYPAAWSQRLLERLGIQVQPE